MQMELVDQMKGCVENSSKWLLINYQILLPNCLVSACEKKENLTWHQVSLRAFFHTPLQMEIFQNKQMAFRGTPVTFFRSNWMEWKSSFHFHKISISSAHESACTCTTFLHHDDLSVRLQVLCPHWKSLSRFSNWKFWLNMESAPGDRKEGACYTGHIWLADPDTFNWFMYQLCWKLVPLPPPRQKKNVHK